MKYLLLFGGTADYQKGFAAMSPEDQQRGLDAVSRWLEQHGSKLGAHNRLTPAETATTVRFGDGGSGAPVVKDGPFLEGKELLGGYCEIDVADLDEAIELATTWPARGVVEISPIMQAPLTVR
jgi:hypothetical protein